jgi:hypothetical protein
MVIESHQLELLRDVGTHIVRLADGRLGPVESVAGRDPAELFARQLRGTG